MKTYSKPDVAVLGDAALLIQSSKPHFSENGTVIPNTLSEDLD